MALAIGNSYRFFPTDVAVGSRSDCVMVFYLGMPNSTPNCAKRKTYFSDPIKRLDVTSKFPSAETRIHDSETLA
jgi:hypothetical protein